MEVIEGEAYASVRQYAEVHGVHNLATVAARATVNHQTWNNWNAANPGQSNSYQIAGVGAGLDWRISRDVLLSASLATPLGNNPGADTRGNNVDGKGQSTRVWLGLNARF
jgi:hypothetical protein